MSNIQKSVELDVSNRRIEDAIESLLIKWHQSKKKLTWHSKSVEMRRLFQRLYSCTIKEACAPITKGLKYEIKKLEEENKKLKSSPQEPLPWEELKEKAKCRLRSGHNDTCGKMLGDYPCSCGQTELEEILSRFPERGGEKW